MNKLRNVSVGMLLAGLLLINGCTAIDALVTQPTTPRGTVVVVYSQIEAGYNTVYERVQSGLLDKEKGKEYVAKLDKANNYTDLASQSIEAGDPAATDQYLVLAQTILNELERSLKNE